MVKETLEAIGAKSMADMGKAMKAVNEKVAGRAEGSAVAAMAITAAPGRSPMPTSSPR